TLMNLQLDTQNWNLRKDVTEIAQKRILRPVVDLKEFSKAYSDELSCYRYIAQLKTEKKVLCRKCNSDSFGKGKDTFDKRCTKCGYNESVTANTLFHKLKFPIDKAFYMTHLVFTRNDITTEELSELVSLRKETCYQFKKKVLDRMHELDPKVLDSWDVLILND
ncbi:MAG TPA: hypothetical protein VL947_04260, partial [Cytophagales bacterium]|nr:hypothetical protein [Cytophagales bacterium]